MPADPDPTASASDADPRTAGADHDPAELADPAATPGSAPDPLGALRASITGGLTARDLPALPPTAVGKAAAAVVLAAAVVAGGLVWLVVGRSGSPATVDLYGPIEEATPGSSSVGEPSVRAGSTPGSGTTAPVAVGGPDATAAPAAVHAHAAGAVVGPGLYRLRAGARVADLVAAAGGPTPDADVDRVNLAAALADGSRVYVPRKGEASVPSVADAIGAGAAAGAPGGGAPGGPTGTTAAGPVNLNTATVEQLDTLPGVGPATAQAIVDHRSRNGPFRSVDELTKVKGIGPAKLAELRPRVTV